MKQALNIEQTSNQPKSHVSSTKLNICAILSQMKKHREAIEYAKSAVQDLLEIRRLVEIKQIEDR